MEDSDSDSSCSQTVIAQLEQVLSLCERFATYDQLVAALTPLVALARTGEIRDYDGSLSEGDFPLFQASKFYVLLGKLLPAMYAADSMFQPEPVTVAAPDMGPRSEMDDFSTKIVSKSAPSRLPLLHLYEFITRVVQLSEFDSAVADDSGGFTTALISLCIQRFSKATCPQELGPLKTLCYRLYYHFPSLRRHMRAEIGSCLNSLARGPENESSGTIINSLLGVYSPVAAGFQAPLKNEHIEFLSRSVLPLHRGSGKLNVTTAVLTLFHERLVFVVSQFLSKQPTLGPNVMSEVFLAWPDPRSANTPKEILLLHEMEALLEFIPQEQFGLLQEQLLSRLSLACLSENHRVAERALRFFTANAFRKLALGISDFGSPVALTRADHPHRQKTLSFMIPAVYGEGKKHWNGTVNKMRAAALSLLIETATLAGFKIPSVEAIQEAIVAFQPAQELGVEELEVDSSCQAGTQMQVPKQFEEIKYTNFVFGHSLGSGSFASVVYAKKINRELMPSRWREYAVKMMDKQLIAGNKYEENVKREVTVLNTLRHPNITRLLGTCESKQYYYLVLEYCARGDLHTVIRRQGSLQPQACRIIMGEIICGLEHMHSQNVVYNDLKPENILIHESGHIKLADFGAARILSKQFASEEANQRIEGTKEYLAPEVVQLGGGSAGLASDLWALGCVLYQMLAGRTPVWVPSKQEVKQPEPTTKSRRGGVSFGTSDVYSDEFSKVDFPVGFPSSASELVLTLLTPDPAARLQQCLSEEELAQYSSRFESEESKELNLSKLKQHPFFEGMAIDTSSLLSSDGPVLTSGAVAAAPDAQWSRRKNSVMFAPLPEQYTFEQDTVSFPPITEIDEPLPKRHSTSAHIHLPVSSSASSASAASAASSFEKKQPPLTITGVAPWASSVSPGAGSWKVRGVSGGLSSRATSCFSSDPSASSDTPSSLPSSSSSSTSSSLPPIPASFVAGAKVLRERKK